jgi:hypothetical protein
VSDPSASNVPPAWLARGYRAALERFDDTANQRDPEIRLIPLFEALNWAVAIVFPDPDRALWPDDEIVKGLRFARGRVHHQWAEALEPRDVPIRAATVVSWGGGGFAHSGLVLDWFWKPLDELPDPDPGHRGGMSEYRDDLAGNSVRHALAHLDALLSKLHSA